ncbi:hypothetical protein GUJ93_ZPchr0013g38010 [Zizania palustris]|uniref:FLZ-type domain-containing protein n=1 Tax=Zizania palustris TaxID=103762 RepID=A0A8J5X332_ZIZPA|nr:hypothetical protein GUJ93_ZPchr0013g38010 [Zizania palustris]
MLKKRCDPHAPSPLSSKLTRHSNGGRPSPLALSPRSLPSFSPRSFSMDAPALSPTAMLEQAKNLPFASPRNPPNGSGSGRSCGAVGAPVTGLAGVLVASEAEQGCCRNGRVLLGLRLRVQLPPKKGLCGDMPPSSPIEFGVKNRDAQLALLSPVQRSPLSSAARAAQSEVELAEDYTCIIARGPNPKMTHIFDDRVVESCGDACCLLSSCYGCKKNKDALFLQHRGAKAFCSSQCCHHEVIFDKRIDELSDMSFKLKR